MVSKIPIILLLAGAAVMLASIFTSAKLATATSMIPEHSRARIRLYLRIHQLLMAFFFIGYLIVAYASLKDMAFVSEVFVSIIFFFGALFVLLGITLQSKMLQEIHSTISHLEKLVELRTANLVETNRALEQENHERAQAESALRTSMTETQQANEKLNHVNQNKERFIASLNHELRSPLSSIVSCTDMLSSSICAALDTQQQKYVMAMRKCALFLMKLADDVLDLARIDAGSEILDVAPASTSQLIEEVEELIHVQLEDKQLSINTHIDEDARALHVDHRRCKQILINLISNAIKLSPANSAITINARADNNDMVRLEVSDQGRGIEPDKSDKIFEDFYQADAQHDRAIGGIGIGLALTRRFVKLHKGEIGVESELGKGCTIWFTLPTQPTNEHANTQNNLPH